jgi:hypothetical protein
MNRRSFLAAAVATAVTLAVDPERLLWTPGQRTHILPPRGGWRRGPLTFADLAFVTCPLDFEIVAVPDPVFEEKMRMVREHISKIDREMIRSLRDLHGPSAYTDLLVCSRDYLSRLMLEALETRQLQYMIVPRDPIPVRVVDAKLGLVERV